MRENLLYLSLLATLFVGCSTNDEATQGSEMGYGSLAISALVEVGVETRSDTYSIATELIPTSESLSITIEGLEADEQGSYYYQKYDNLDAYNSAEDDGETQSPPMLLEGDYLVTLSNEVDPTAESATNALFEGSATMTVVARDYEKQETISVVLTNSIVRLETTTDFDNYFAGGATLTLSTDNGAELYLDTHNKSEDILFVVAETTLYLEGEGVKQPATEDPDSGTSVTFTKSEIGTAAKGAMTTISVDAQETGGAYITITFDETIKYIDIPIQLNPES